MSRRAATLLSRFARHRLALHLLDLARYVAPCKYAGTGRDPRTGATTARVVIVGVSRSHIAAVALKAAEPFVDAMGDELEVLEKTVRDALEEAGFEPAPGANAGE